MKMSFLFRALLLCAALCVTLAWRARAQQPDDFKIVNLRPVSSNNLIKIGGAWRKDLPQRIEASLHVAADTPSSTIFVKAYFYDRTNQLVASYNEPNHIWAATSKGIEEVGLPTTLSHLKNTDAYFAIPEDLQAKKWTTVLVVFGNDTKVAASANPATSLQRLDFPEKARLPAKTP